MSEWKEYRFSDFANVNSSVKIPKDQLVSFVEMKDLTDGQRFCKPSQERILSGGSRFENGDTLFARITPCLENGKICQVKGLKNGIGFGSTEFHVLRGRATVSDSDFVYYLCRWSDVRDHAEKNFDGTSGRQRVPKQAFDDLYLKLPELPEQKSIASILSSLDDKIDLLHRQNATLEKMAETLFRQWFVEPIKKIENEGYKDNNFSNAKFDKWIKETVGGEWGKESLVGDFNKEVYCIRGTDIADLNTGLPERTPIRFIKQAKFNSIEPYEGDLILEISGGTESQSTGRVCYINQDIKNLFKHPLVFSNFCRMIRVKKLEYSFFLYCYIQYLYNQDEFFNLENGSSGIKNLDYKALLFELDYPMPKEKLVLDFHKQVEPLFKKVNQNKTQIHTLTALRDTLLPKLMSGEVRVS